MEVVEKEKSMPLVSVVMPSYNKERFVEQSVRSVIGQTYANWEMIIVDDCSSDSTYKILQKLAAEEPRIRLIRNTENMGAARTRNLGFDLAQGEYAALLDSDDIWHPEKLERQLRIACSTGVDIVYCSYGIINESGRKKCDDFIVPETTNFESSLTKGVISCSTAVLSRKIVDNYRFESEYYHEDLAFWFRLLRDGCEAKGDPEILAEYRMADGAKSSNKIKTALFRWDIYRNMLGFSVLKSSQLLLHYMVLGIKKYRRREG